MNLNNFIAKLIRDFGIEHIDKYDIAEWVTEALGLMKHSNVIKESIVCLNVNNYKTILPVDVIDIKQLGKVVNNTGIPAFVLRSNYIPKVTVEPIRKSSATLTNTSNYSYKRDKNIIRFSFDSGKVLGLVTSFVFDGEGFPLIPDGFDAINALAFYCMASMEKRKFIKEGVSNNYVFYNSEWRRYLGQFESSALTVDLDTLENLRTQQNKFFKGDQYNKFFSGLSDEGSKNNSYSIGRGDQYLRLGYTLGEDTRISTMHDTEFDVDCFDDDPQEVCDGYLYYNNKSCCHRSFDRYAGWNNFVYNKLHYVG